MLMNHAPNLHTTGEVKNVIFSSSVLYFSGQGADCSMHMKMKDLNVRGLAQVPYRPAVD